MVERFNRTLLLWSYVDHQADWEQYLPLVLFDYSLTNHPSTGFSPFALMYRRPPLKADVPHLSAFDPISYQSNCGLDWLNTRTLLKGTSHCQKIDCSTKPRCFQVGDCVWLSCPTAGKLDPWWEGR